MVAMIFLWEMLWYSTVTDFKYIQKYLPDVKNTTNKINVKKLFKMFSVKS